MGKYDELLDRVVLGSAEAVNQFPVDQFDHLVRHAGVSSQKFRDELTKHLQSKTRRDANEVLQQLHMDEYLDELEKAERDAWDRRVRYSANPSEASMNDTPVHLADYSVGNLIDCQLLRLRQQWIAELRSREESTNGELMSLNNILVAKKEELRSKLEEVELKLRQLKGVGVLLE